MHNDAQFPCSSGDECMHTVVHQWGEMPSAVNETTGFVRDSTVAGTAQHLQMETHRPHCVCMPARTTNFRLRPNSGPTPSFRPVLVSAHAQRIICARKSLAGTQRSSPERRPGAARIT